MDLAKVSIVSGGVVLIPVCSGELRGRLFSSPVVSSRSGRDRWRGVNRVTRVSLLVEVMTRGHLFDTRVLRRVLSSVCPTS